MKKLRWQLLIVILALAAIGLLLLGQKPGVLPTDTVSVPKPIAGGVYTEGLVGVVSRLNPALDFYNPADQDINRLLYSRLIQFDARGIPSPDLAESWGISPDGTLYNLSIRAEAKWHDGEPVTASDVLFTIELLRDPDIPLPEDLRELWNEIEVEQLGDHLIQFRLPEPFAPFLDYLTFGILPQHLLGSLTAAEIIDAPFNMAPVGSGPYRFDHFIVEDGAVIGAALAANDDYYHARPFIDQFVFRYYPDAAAALAAYRAGEIMGLGQITTDILPDALKEPELSVYTGRLPEMTLIILNLDNPETPFLGETAVRTALMQALNRQGMVDRILFGQAILAHGPIFPGTWAYHEADEMLGFDPEAATARLKAEGYTIPAEGGSVRAKDEVFLEFTLLHPAEEPYASFAADIQRYWAAIGVEVTLEAVTHEALVEEYLNPRNYHAALVTLNLSNAPDPDPYPFWHQAQATGGQNYARWDDRPASEYLEQARVTLDIAERTRLYRNFQIRFVRELPALPLYYPVYSYGVAAEVQGVQLGPLFAPSDRLANAPAWYLRAELTIEE